MIAIADHIVDVGPRAGREGGEVVYQGSFAGLARAQTLTGRSISRTPQLNRTPRAPQGWLPLRNVSRHNLQNVNVDIPKGVMTAVVGVAGSGKSSLINGAFARRYPEAICIDQGALSGSRRSNMATYTGLLDPIRNLFAAAGHSGGKIVFQGTVERLAADGESLTGIHLQRHLRGSVNASPQRNVHRLRTRGTSARSA